MIALNAARYLLFIFDGIDPAEAIRQALHKNRVSIEELNLRQLLNGIDSTGRKITPPYTDSTVKRKLNKGQPHDRVTLRDTGELYESVYLKVFQTAFDINASDPKLKWLLPKYGENVLGLTDENIKVAADIIKPDLIVFLKEQIRKLKANANKESITS